MPPKVVFKAYHNTPGAGHPLGPKIVFSYGMTKCGSTLAFEIARTGLDLAGFDQPKLKSKAVNQSSKINFVRHLQTSDLEEIWEEVEEIGHPIVLKTHTRPDIPVIDFINQGRALIQATYRDPRDMALSMIDNGEKNRHQGKLAFAEITCLNTAMDNIMSQIDSFTQWLYRPNCLPIYFEDLAFNTDATARFILGQLGLDISAAFVSKTVKKKRFTQKNKGTRHRHKEEMSPCDSQRFQSAFAPLYEVMIRKRRKLLLNGEAILPDGTLLIESEADKLKETA